MPNNDDDDLSRMVAKIGLLHVKDVISNDFVVHKAEYETDAGRPVDIEKDRNAE